MINNHFWYISLDNIQSDVVKLGLGLKLRTFPSCNSGSTQTHPPYTPLSIHPPACGTLHKQRKEYGWMHSQRSAVCLQCPLFLSKWDPTTSIPQLNHWTNLIIHTFYALRLSTCCSDSRRVLCLSALCSSDFSSLST